MKKTLQKHPIDRYCSKCGKKMEVRQIIAKNHPNYDSVTGRQFKYYHYRCPDAHWWNLHDVVNEDWVPDI